MYVEFSGGKELCKRISQLRSMCEHIYKHSYFTHTNSWMCEYTI